MITRRYYYTTCGACGGPEPSTPIQTINLSASGRSWLAAHLGLALSRGTRLVGSVIWLLSSSSTRSNTWPSSVACCKPTENKTPGGWVERQLAGHVKRDTHTARTLRAIPQPEAVDDRKQAGPLAAISGEHFCTKQLALAEALLAPNSIV